LRVKGNAGVCIGKAKEAKHHNIAVDWPPQTHCLESHEHLARERALPEMIENEQAQHERADAC